MIRGALLGHYGFGSRGSASRPSVTPTARGLLRSEPLRSEVRKFRYRVARMMRMIAPTVAPGAFCTMRDSIWSREQFAMAAAAAPSTA